MSNIDIKFLKSWEGKQQLHEDILTLFPTAALLAALDHEVSPRSGDQLEGLCHWLYFLPVTQASKTGRDGHPQTGGFLPPVPLPRRMWAAGNVSFNKSLVLGQAAQKTSTIKSIQLKEGRSGELVFVNLEHQIHQNDQLCIVEEQNLVYRAMPEKLLPTPAGVVPELTAEFGKTITPDPVLLQRYSALTYNSHRIHYDRDYAKNEEFYPALVVHGPLLATLLMDLCLNQFPELSIQNFTFRAQRPTFDDHPFRIEGRSDGENIKLWTVDHEGFVGMSATAQCL